ncbi:AUGMIN subunit 5 [Asimina triloba]
MQKAHVQQFVATEDALNKAAEALNLSQKLIKRLHGSNAGVSSNMLPVGSNSQNLGSLRHFELDVWAKERDAAGLRASVTTLTSEVQRLNKLCAEWKEAEDALRKKWKKIEEFDARRSELEVIYTALLQANTDSASFWNQQPLAAREYASSTIIPACAVVVDLSTNAKDLIEKELLSFSRSPDNRLYMLPSTPQTLEKVKCGRTLCDGQVQSSLSACAQHIAIPSTPVVSRGHHKGRNYHMIGILDKIFHIILEDKF